MPVVPENMASRTYFYIQYAGYIRLLTNICIYQICLDEEFDYLYSLLKLRIKYSSRQKLLLAPTLSHFQKPL